MLIFPADKECYIKNFGTIYSAVNDTLYKNVLALKKFNALPASISDIDTVQMKIASDAEFDYDASFFQKSSLVKEGVLFVPKKFSDTCKIILLRRSILLYKNNLIRSKPNQFHHPINNFSLEQFLDHFEEDVDYHILKEHGPFYTKRLEDYAVMNFLHQKNVNDYGLYLYEQDAKITSILNCFDSSFINAQERAFLDQIWYSSAYENNSSIILNGSRFSNSGRMRGIAYAKSEISSETVSSVDIMQNLHLQTTPKFSDN